MAKINPERRSIEKSGLMYCLYEGSEIKFLSDFSIKDYQLLLERGWFEARLGDGVWRIFPMFAELIIGIQGHDFGIDEMNGDRILPRRGKRVLVTPNPMSGKEPYYEE